MPDRKYGRRPPSNGPALRLADILSGQLATTTVDYSQYAAGLQMWLNDQYGTCVAATWACERLMLSSLSGNPFVATDAQIEKLYKTQNPGFPNQDDGMDIQTALNYLRKTGGPDGVKLLAFAKVDLTNEIEVRAANLIFGTSPWWGINVEGHNQDQFDAGQTWTYSKSDPIEGGHSTAGNGNTTTLFQMATWQNPKVMFDDGFYKNLAEEGWVTIWPEHLGTVEFETGIDVTALQAEWAKITTDPFPIPTPTPTPTPTPGPTPVPPKPTPAVIKWWREFLAWIESL